jgi:glycosyltransferase involved in cell wall biosynthesis
MGKPWDYPAFIETLRKQKQTDHFKLFQVVYDLIPVFFPHLFGLPLFEPYTQHMFETAAVSDGLLAISKSTKKDMEKFCDDMLLPTPPIEVLRLGDDFTTVTPKKPAVDSLEPGNFILCVGTLEARKNHALLYMAYKEGLARGVKLPQLVIVGGRGWYTEDIVYAFKHDPELRGLVHMGGRTDRELEWLYQNCRFTVYPSMYEGWGLPIAESLARGKVCVASNTSSMTEIAGDLIDYFSPYDSAACLAAIKKYLDEDTLQKKETKIHSAYKTTTWDATFKQVENYLEQWCT